MGGLAVVLLLVGYLALVLWLVMRVRGPLAKLIVLIIAILLPTADAIVGRIYLRHLCNTEGGLHVSRQVSGIDGFQDRGGADEAWVRQHGFRFVETKPRSNGLVDRIERRDDKIVLLRAVPARSAYRVHLRTSVARRPGFAVDEYVVEDVASGDIVSRYTDVGFTGGWVERLVGRLSDAGPGTGARCGLPERFPEKRLEKLVIATFPR